MSIKSQGGVFGRNPTFNDVNIEGDLSVNGALTINGAAITGLNYQGNWNADTNTPDIAASSVLTGQFWIVSVGGSTNVGGITNWTQGDWALYDGSAWQRVEGGSVDLTSGVTGTLPIANGGTGATDAATVKQNLDLEVGVDIQAYDAGLTSIANLPTIADKMIYTTATDTWSTASITSAGRAILDDADVSAQRTTLGLGSAATTDSTDYATSAQGSLADSALQSSDIGVSVQGYDTDTAKYDDATANFTGTLQNGGSNVVVDSDIGSTVQAYNAGLSTGAFTVNTSAPSSSVNIDADGHFLVGTTSRLTNHLYAGSTGAGSLWGFGPYIGAANSFYVSYNANQGVYLVGGNTSWSSNSDERMKDVIEPIVNARNKIKELRTVIGKYKSDPDGTRRSFLIAQDVQKVLPEAVDANNPEKLGVQYTDLIPLLTAAIKEQQTLIESLENRIQALENN